MDLFKIFIEKGYGNSQGVLFNKEITVDKFIIL